MGVNFIPTLSFLFSAGMTERVIQNLKLHPNKIFIIKNL